MDWKEELRGAFSDVQRVVVEQVIAALEADEQFEPADWSHRTLCAVVQAVLELNESDTPHTIRLKPVYDTWRLPFYEGPRERNKPIMTIRVVPQ